MSVAEIMKELLRLSVEERRELARALAELDEAAPQARDLKPSDPQFIAAKAHVFDHYGELLRRLAQ